MDKLDIFNKAYEPENQFILRLPEDQAEKLQEILMAGNLKDRLTVEIHNDYRHGVVRLDGETLSAKLLDLPCIIEGLKTLDMKTFYKTADISQILVCSREEDADSQASEKLLHKDKKHQWPHGLTPPLKNVRKRRFRKTARKKYIDSPDIEKEVKRLLKTDMEAVSVHYEIINEEEKPSKSSLSKTTDVTDQDELHRIFQDLSSSDSDNEKEDINVEDYDVIKDFDPSEIPKGIPIVADREERERLEARLEQFLSELGELQKRKQRKENLVKGENIKNEMLKMRFQSELEELTQRIVETRQDYAMTLAQLGRNR